MACTLDDKMKLKKAQSGTMHILESDEVKKAQTGTAYSRKQS